MANKPGRVFGINDIAKYIAKEQGVTIQQAKSHVKGVFAVMNRLIAEEMKSNDSMIIKNLFSVKVLEGKVRDHKFKNYTTKKTTNVKMGGVYLKFKAARKLKEFVRGRLMDA